MKPIKLTDRNIMFSRPMTRRYDLNLGLILGERNNYVIDTGFGSGSVLPMLEFIAKNKPTVVVNTHCHWDHIWGNWMFEGDTIIAHKLCRELSDKYWYDAIKENSDFMHGEVRKCLPNMVFNEGSIFFPDDGVEVFWSPGHSEDCISVYDAADKVLYAGDNIGDTMDAVIPIIETDMPTFRKLLDTYGTYDFTVCVSGHNKPQGKDILAKMKKELPRV